MARAALNWTVRDQAAATGLHRNTITNIEVGRYAGDPATLNLIKEVLIREGVVFIDENGGGPAAEVKPVRGNRSISTLQRRRRGPCPAQVAREVWPVMNEKIVNLS
jgi:hypothetical protein